MPKMVLLMCRISRISRDPDEENHGNQQNTGTKRHVPHAYREQNCRSYSCVLCRRHPGLVGIWSAHGSLE